MTTALTQQDLEDLRKTLLKHRLRPTEFRHDSWSGTEMTVSCACNPSSELSQGAWEAHLAVELGWGWAHDLANATAERAVDGMFTSLNVRGTAAEVARQAARAIGEQAEGEPDGPGRESLFRAATGLMETAEALEDDGWPAP